MSKQNNKSKKSVRSLAIIGANLIAEKVLGYGEGDTVVKVTVKKCIPFEKRAELVRGIAETVISKEATSISGYYPEYLKLAQKYLTVAYYTDIVMPDDINEMWEILQNSTLYDDVVDFVGNDIYDIYDESERLIETRVAYLENNSEINEIFMKIAETIITYGKKISESLSTMGTKFTSDKVEEMIGVLKNVSTISPESIVGAILKTKDELTNSSSHDSESQE